MKLYHYTTPGHLERILQDGEIKLATASAPRGTKPVAWVSANEHFEITALKKYTNVDNAGNYGSSGCYTFQEQLDEVGLVRIEVKHYSNLHTWGKLKYSAKYDEQTYYALERGGLNVGANPNEWYGSIKPIPAKYFIKIEIYDVDKWVEYEPKRV